MKINIIFSVNKNTGTGKRRRRRRQAAQFRKFFDPLPSGAILDFERLEEILQSLGVEGECGGGYPGFLLWMEEIMF